VVTSHKSQVINAKTKYLLYHVRFVVPSLHTGHQSPITLPLALCLFPSQPQKVVQQARRIEREKARKHPMGERRSTAASTAEGGGGRGDSSSSSWRHPPPARWGEAADSSLGRREGGGAAASVAEAAAAGSAGCEGGEGPYVPVPTLVSEGRQQHHQLHQTPTNGTAAKCSQSGVVSNAKEDGTEEGAAPGASGDGDGGPRTSNEDDTRASASLPFEATKPQTTPRSQLLANEWRLLVNSPDVANTLGLTSGTSEPPHERASSSSTFAAA
jgi:hypothetical protein